ncbi:precorrin-3B C(17)-methyltransferase [Prochlorococcus marinus]|uniref:precorrin-3B C(17)-methyltransferase n=1 Tax=Prochlorococcus marinus TaxID=1219 RepID=UPI0022B4D238|nr:precorrin-3B C(17)-methyltransferase [Prochlorococcus marinus]
MKPNKRIALGFSSSAFSLLQRIKTRGHAEIIALTPGAVSQIDIRSEEILIDRPEKLFQRFWGPDTTFIVIGAIGAVIRIIAPLLTEKTKDPAVLVMDSRAKNIVPILGGHKAGAEELACHLSEDFGAQSIFTGFSRTENFLSIDSFGDTWGWKRSGSIADWNNLMMHISKKLSISFEQNVGSTLWNSSEGALNLFSKKSNTENNSLNTPLFHICSEALNKCCWHPPMLWVGIGCEKNTSESLIERSLTKAFAEAGLAKEAIAGLATIDIKSNEIGIKSLQLKAELPIRFYTAEELAKVSVPNPSKIVQLEVDTHSVAEASSLLAAGKGGSLKFPKHIYKSLENEIGAVTIAISQSKEPFAPQRGELHLIGTGPGEISFLTNDSRYALSRSAIWIGYKRYLDLIEPLRRFDQVRIDSSLTNEKERCSEALRLATQGVCVALISSGDSGIYGMAGLALELWLAKTKAERPDFQVHPGISALQVAASKIGAPLMHDFCAISLSDCLTPWGQIEERIKAASDSDFVIAFYNPRSKERSWQLQKALNILMTNRSRKTPVVFAYQVGRSEEEVKVYTLESVPIDRVNMLTVLLVGNSDSFVNDGYVVTPRGY